MDFRQLIKRIEPKLRRLALILNNPEVSPTVRMKANRAAFDIIGQLVYDKAYDMSAWDFDIYDTLGKIFDKNIAAGLAKSVSDSIATGDKSMTSEQIVTFTNTAAQTAVTDAFNTAKSLGEVPRLYISVRGKGDCDWCIARANGSPYYDPGPSLFGRHNHCDCIIRAEGYRSRNGEVKNYRV